MPVSVGTHTHIGFPELKEPPDFSQSDPRIPDNCTMEIRFNDNCENKSRQTYCIDL